MGELGKLKGIALKSEKHLNEIGIYTKKQLEEVDPIVAYIKLKRKCHIKPSLNFLYAMVGALEDEHWAAIAKSEKARLLMELEGYQSLEEILLAENPDAII